MKVRCMNCMEEYEDEQDHCPLCGFVRGTPPREIYHLHPGVVLVDRYVIGVVVACGGFGILYRAWDEDLQVMVAVKEYFPSVYVNRNPGEKDIFIYTNRRKGEFEKGLECFLEEARNTAKFSGCLNIVKVYDYFRCNKTAYMVMEYMDGITLKQYTREQGGKIGWQKAVEIIAGICDDLQTVHEGGILHRDISPDNIMLCKDGSVKLFDFGASCIFSAECEMTRIVVLKMGFAPPEQYCPRSLQGPWTDVYALGATLYRTITGVFPDESVNRRRRLLEEGKDTLDSLGELEKSVPKYLNIAVCKAMSIEPSLRFKSVLELKEALLNKRQYAVSEKELQAGKRKQKWKRAVLAALLGVGAAGCIFYYCSRQSEMAFRGADVSIWVSVTQQESEEERKAQLNEMLKEFHSNYPKVRMDVICIPEEEYHQKLVSAAAAVGGFPTLYESDKAEGLEERQEELSDILKMVHLNDYYYLNKAVDEDGVLRRLPLGLHMAVIYVNVPMLENDSVPLPRNDKMAFMEKRSVIWLGDSNDYDEVQEKLSGIYSVRSLQQPEAIAGFDEFWSVDSQARRVDKMAAKRILYYFLGETEQDILHVRNSASLPLNKNEFSAYLDVNRELGFLEDQLKLGKTVKFLEGAAFRNELDNCYVKLIEDSQAIEEMRKWQSRDGK